MIIFALPPHEQLARAMARAHRARLGRIERRTFSDGERSVRPVTPVRRQRVMVIANTGPDATQLLDCLILLHAVRASGARSTTVVIPYLAYARQDRTTRPQEPVTIALLATLLEAAGAEAVVLVDPHSAASIRAFRVPVHVGDALPALARGIIPRAMVNTTLVVVAPDAGARDRAQRLARILGNRDVIVLRKARPRPNTARIAALTPHDRRLVRDRHAILVDDMIDTAGTITAAAQHLRTAGAARITILATHAVLSGPALARLRRARVDQIIVSNSLPIARRHRLPLRTVSLAAALTTAIRTTYGGKRWAGIV